MSDKRKHIRIPSESVFTQNVNKGHGGKTYLRSNHSEHGKKPSGRIASVRESFKNNLDNNQAKNLFFQVKTPDDVKIKDHKGKLKNLGMDVVSFSQNPSAASIQISRENFNLLEKKIAEYTTSEKHVGKSNLAVIEELRQIPVEEKLGKQFFDFENENKEVGFIISLFTVLSSAEKEAIAQSLSFYFKEKNLPDFKMTKLGSGQILLSGKAPLRELKEAGEKFYTINCIQPSGKIFANKSFKGEPLPNSLKINAPNSKIVVGVIDTGIDTSTMFGPLTTESQNLIPAGTSNNFEHGSMVTSRVLFGDNVESKISSLELTPECLVANIMMLGENTAGEIVGHEEADFISILEAVVLEKKDSIKIYNLSIGRDSISDGSFSAFSKELDFLSRTHGIIFIISAGNIDSPKSPFPASFLHPNSRIQTPAESLLSITVGSLANFSGDGMLSRVGEISPFSCIGPGADKGIKPEVVSHGGNLSNTWSAHPRTAAYGLDATGTALAYDVGTSFSAPIISNYCAQIKNNYPEATPNLVKALLIHFCKPVLHPAIVGLTHQEFCGFGEPQIQKVINGVSDSVCYFYEGKIKKDTYQFIKFHIPNCLAPEAEETKLCVRVTVVYNPPINLDNPIEYSKCKMSLSLFKNTSSGLNEIAMDSVYNKGYSPILSFGKSFSRNFASGEWQLKLRLTTKDDLPEDFEQEFAAIIEVIDTNGKGTVYDDVLVEFASVYGLRIIRKAA